MAKRKILTKGEREAVRTLQKRLQGELNVINQSVCRLRQIRDEADSMHDQLGDVMDQLQYIINNLTIN